MNFLDAIEKLKSGDKIFHRDFEKNSYLFERNDCIVIKYPKMEMDFVYRPSVSEILSDGWEIWL